MSPCVLVCPRPLHLPRGEIAGHSEQSAARLCRGTYDGWLCLRALVASGHCPSLHGPHSLFAIQRSLVKVAKQEPTRLSLSGGANMYVAVHLLYDSTSFSTGNPVPRARGTIPNKLQCPKMGHCPKMGTLLSYGKAKKNRKNSKLFGKFGTSPVELYVTSDGYKHIRRRV